MKSVLAIDIGGTSTRYCLFSPALSRVGKVHLHPTPNLLVLAGRTPREIKAEVWKTIAANIPGRLNASVGAIGISFAGPINAKGEIVGAPTIWGAGRTPFPLAKMVGELTGLPCYLINDVSAAAWRFSKRVRSPFSIITVSSGVGNKVFHGDAVLVNDHGFGGELGHCSALGFKGVFECDCGGKNHIGAISSGRGTIQLLRAMARDSGSGFRKSALHRASGGKANRLTPEIFVSAVKQGDPFAAKVLRKSVGPIAHSIASLYAMTGIERNIIIGGFANALGRHYKEALIAAMQGLSFYGRKGSLAGMVRISESGDSDCLTGVAIYSLKRLAEAG